jgi:hypothetical protein
MLQLGENMIAIILNFKNYKYGNYYSPSLLFVVYVLGYFRG